MFLYLNYFCTLWKHTYFRIQTLGKRVQRHTQQWRSHSVCVPCAVHTSMKTPNSLFWLFFFRLVLPFSLYIYSVRFCATKYTNAGIQFCLLRMKCSSWQHRVDLLIDCTLSVNVLSWYVATVFPFLLPFSSSSLMCVKIRVLPEDNNYFHFRFLCNAHKLRHFFLCSLSLLLE